MIDIDDIINRRSTKTATTEKVLSDMAGVIGGLTDQLKEVVDLQKQLLSHIQYQDDKIKMLEGLVTDLAPDLDIIEMIAEDEDEKREMITRYLNYDTSVIDEYIP